MKIQAETCVVVFALLLLASMVMQWVRARKRQKLVRQVQPDHLDQAGRQKWNSIDSSFDFIFKDFRKLQIVKRCLDRLPEEIHALYRNYCLVTRMEIAVTASMLVSGVTAFLFCG